MSRRYGLLIAAVVLGLGAAARDEIDRWVNRTDLPPMLHETSVEVIDRQGQLIRAFPVEDGRIRLALRLDQTDPAFIDMLIAYEDKRFFAHAGVDPLALVRAAVQAVWNGEVVSGGSTITMQVARLLENSGTGQVDGKLRQIRVALALERRLSKSEILELYLLHAPYGGRLEGLRAGSLAWFGKEPKRLTRAEAALLVALPQSPETRRPDRNPQTASQARALVLARTSAANSASPQPVPRQMRPIPRLAPHLTDRLRTEAPWIGRHELSLNAELQSQIEELARRAVSGQQTDVSAAIVVANHRTGEILAEVGSPRYSAEGGALGFVDMARAVRSPGSTLKPLIYGLAFDQGLVHPETLVNDAPVTFGRYAPQNFDGHFRGELTVRQALQLSLNIPPVLLTQEIGPPRLMAGLHRSGAKPVLPAGAPGLAIALGGLGLSLHDLVQLYAGLANGGSARPLTVTAPETPQHPQQIMSRSAAWHLGHILSDLPPPAGAAAARSEIAYKTGTSYGHRDAWAIGYDGKHVVGVWLGRPDGTPVPGAFGGELAAPILFEAFGRISPRREPLPLPPPETLIVGAADLPAPLRRFKSRQSAFRPSPESPIVTFPPDGATLLAQATGVPLKMRNGVLPMTVLVNGVPVLTGLRRRDALLDVEGPGFARISVVDAQGQSAQVRIRLD